ncbi:MAG: MotA/TolQ/ExbB proton channel family protein [Bacteroidales bacterium]|jgi:biopolymer transport protein ExbB|nr:MotA/TolQ/ExbB proton channel family protein [Bacteroidales bacterium]
MIPAVLITDPVSADVEVVTSWFELLVKGGVIMIPILLLSLLSVYLFIERFSYIRQMTRIDGDSINNILQKMRSARVSEAITDAQNDNTATGRIILSGLGKADKPVQEIESILESTTNLEITKMEKNTGYLGLIAGIAPMLGFIGTISGVIKIFYNISLADNISIGIIAGGLYQKMICSGAGLIVGVIAYSCYHYLQMEIDRYTIRLQENLLNFLKEL